MRQEIIIKEFDGFKVIYENRNIRLPELFKDINLDKYFTQSKSLDIIDLGCGPSINLLEIHHKYKSHNLLGIDKMRYKPKYKSYEAYKKLEPENKTDFLLKEEYDKFIENSILTRIDCLEFLRDDTNTYDFVIAVNLFHLLDFNKFHEVVQLISNKLKRDGKFYFEIKPNFGSEESDEDKADIYLSVLNEYFTDCRIFLVKNQKYPTDRIIYQNII